MLSFKAAPDYESPGSAAGSNAYAVEVTASDGVNVDTQTLTVTVTNENDNAPVIDGGDTASVSVKENTTAVTTVVASDADGTLNPLVYSIVGGADALLFGIDATGKLSFAAAPDFEGTADHDYEVVVQVSDGTTSTRRRSR